MLTEAEVQAYQLLFEKKVTSIQASQELAKKGIDFPPEKLRAFKITVAQKMEREAREERMFENMLESFERTKFEFEDSVKRLKDWIIILESKGDIAGAMTANRDLITQMNLALKSLGKLNDQMVNIRAKNVNVISSTDFVEAFKKILFGMFADMEAQVDGTKVVFTKPTPELLDDFNKWKAEQARKKAVVVDVEPIVDDFITGKAQ